MPAFLLWIGVVLSIGVSLFGFRLRYPLAELTTAAAVAVLVWWGLTNENQLIIVAAPLLLLPLFGIRIPLLLDGGARRHGESEEGGVVREPARYLNGPLASLWRGGELELAGEQLRFRLTDGSELFDEHVAELRQVSKDPLGRADLVIEAEDETHRIALGHHRLGRDEHQRAQRYWMQQIEAGGGPIA